MTRQNNEDPALPQGIRKSAETRTVESVGGGKWVPVNKEMRQLALNFESAENPKAFASGVVGGSAGGQISAAPCAALLSKSTAKRALSATMKRRSTIARRLIALGVKRTTAWRRVYQGRKSLWALSHDPAVDRAPRNAYFAKRGFEPITEQWRARRLHIGAPRQLRLPLG